MRKKDLLFVALLILMAACRSGKAPSSGNQNLVEAKGKSKPNETSSATKKATSVIEAARSYLGTPYKYAGMDRKGIDCSGLMCNSFREIGISLPHQSTEQSKLGTEIKLHDLKPGDLVFIGAKKGSSKITHVGLVVNVGGGKIIFIHASTKRGVIEENLLEKWYEPLFIKGVRLL